MILPRPHCNTPTFSPAVIAPNHPSEWYPLPTGQGSLDCIMSLGFDSVLMSHCLCIVLEILKWLSLLINRRQPWRRGLLEA